APTVVATYSALVVDSATEACFLHRQDMIVPLICTIAALTDFRSFLSPTKSASVICSGWLGSPSAIIESSRARVPLRYRALRLDSFLSAMVGACARRVTQFTCSGAAVALASEEDVTDSQSLSLR
ncbi:hypothetical protein PHYSODRAFT_516489, partial [Phytophthora sojae]